MRAFREMAKQPGDLAGQVIKEMQWDKGQNPVKNLTSEENLELNKYCDLMTPIEFLFVELNAENRCTVHRVYPTLKVFFLCDVHFLTVFFSANSSFSGSHHRRQGGHGSFVLQGVEKAAVRLFLLCSGPQ